MTTDTTLITSVQNPRVKAVVQLHQRKYRQEQHRILIEGRHPVAEALRAGLAIHELYVREGEVWAEEASIPAVPVTEAVMARMATTDTPVPVLAIATPPEHAGEQVFAVDSPRILGLVGIQDPGNLGTLIRSACAFGVTGLLLMGSSADAYQPKVIRASAGLVFRLPLGYLADPAALREPLLARSDLPVWGADAHQGASYRNVHFGDKWLLMMGSEAHGLPDDTWALAKPLHIPMSPAAESLNVGVAGAILLAEAYQQLLPSPGHA